MIATPTQTGNAISIRGLSKAYRIQTGGLEKQSTLAETALARIRNPLKRGQKETFYALQDIDLEVNKGEVLGIIGRNGAGKSTLLKVLSRITYPTTGEIDLHGRVGSLLEVGTGFHPELTGRENIFLNGTILGMSRSEIKREFDAIVEFASVEQFLDTPVKRYSSGMRVRLAFSVAAHLRSEILIIDEVLAVGDADFQKKCLAKMQQITTGQGRTVLFVSHQINNVRNLCHKGLLLSNGKMHDYGNVEDVIKTYYDLGVQPTVSEYRTEPQGEGSFVINYARPEKPIFHCSEPKKFRIRVSPAKRNVKRCALRIEIANNMYDYLTRSDSRVLGVWIDSNCPTDLVLTMHSPWLRPGTYTIDASLVGDKGVGFIDKAKEISTFDVSDILPYPHTAIPTATNAGFVLSDFTVTQMRAEKDDA